MRAGYQSNSISVFYLNRSVKGVAENKLKYIIYYENFSKHSEIFGIRKFRVIKTAIFVIGILLAMLGSPSGAPPYGEDESEVPTNDAYSWLKSWVRPEGPAKVGLQAGHWKNEELPEELHKLRGSTGSSGGGKAEWEVNLEIVEYTADILRERGVAVDIIPATVPESYWADAFVAVHADGNINSHVSGYKIASPWRDWTGRAKDLAYLIDNAYAEATDLTRDPNISRNMRGYYAFSHWKYSHAVHPMTAAVILESGFITSPADRKILLGSPDIPASGLAKGILDYLENQNLLVN